MSLETVIADRRVADLQGTIALREKQIENQAQYLNELTAHLTALRAVLHMDAGADAAQVIERVGAVVEALTEARLQIEYLDGKFQPTGTSAAVLAKIRAALHGAP